MRFITQTLGITALASVALLTGCSQEETNLNPKFLREKGKELTFRVLTDKTDAHTRALIQKSDLINSFMLYSSYKSQAGLNAFNDQNSNLLYRTDRVDGNYNAWEAATPVFWPYDGTTSADAATYYALSFNGNHFVPGKIGVTTATELNNDVVKLTDFIMPYDENNGDLLVAKTAAVGNTTTTIGLQFQHIASAITFTFENKTEDKDAVVLVKELTLKGFNNKATYTFATAANDATPAEWSAPTGTAGNQAPDFVVLKDGDPSVVSKGFKRTVNALGEDLAAYQRIPGNESKTKADYDQAVKAAQATDDSSAANANGVYPDKAGTKAFFVVPQSFSSTTPASLDIKYAIKRGAKDDFQERVQSIQIGNSSTVVKFEAGKKYNLIVSFEEIKGGTAGGGKLGFEVQVSDYGTNNSTVEDKTIPDPVF